MELNSAAMYPPIVSALVGLLLLALSPIHAQQYAGVPITRTFPVVAGSEVTFFNIKTSTGQNTTLVNYYSRPESTGQRPVPANIKRAIIILTGSNRDPWDYFNSMRNTIPVAAAINPEVSQESVLLIAPWWANTADLPSGDGNTLVWSGNLFLRAFF